MKRIHPLVIIGILAVAAAGLWYWLGRPSHSEVRTDEVSCAFNVLLQDPDGDTSHCTGRITGPTTGPLILVGTGAFSILIGVIRMPPRSQQPPPSPTGNSQA